MGEGGGDLGEGRLACPWRTGEGLHSLGALAWEGPRGAFGAEAGCSLATLHGGGFCTVSADARASQVVKRERWRLRVALLASLLFHLGLLVIVRTLPPTPQRRRESPLVFTLLERPATPPEEKPLPQRPGTSAPLRTGARASAQKGAQEAQASGGLWTVPDVPLAQEPSPGPSLLAMSELAAETVVKQRGPQHAPGDSVEERLAETLARGTGALAVERNGYWDVYFTLLRKALLEAWAHPHFQDTATTHLRLVLDADGCVRDFEVLPSGNARLDKEVEEALHQTTQFPSPPNTVLHGKVELVTEWEFTTHPGLALAQGTPVFGPLGGAVIFDVVTVVNPAVDLTPLEFNVKLASYWTR